MKCLKATINGSYVDNNNEIIPFSDIVEYIPTTQEDVALMHIRRRYVVRAIVNNPEKFKKPFRKVRETFVDFEEDEKSFSFSGKNIGDMTVGELQDLAVYFNLREIQVPNTTSVHAIRMKAYTEYRRKILKEEKFAIPEGATLKTLPPIIVKVEGEKAEAAPVANVSEQKKVTEYTTSELRDIAKMKGIALPAGNLGIDRLYDLVFPS